MKRPELLSPAGNFDCLTAAIEGGCDAVYLAGKIFGARAFSNNFTNEEIVEAIKYSHLYGVKVYVTVNTLIYENEISEFMSYVDFLYKNNVDALIIQDIGMTDLIRQTYPMLELHASTQMHIHNVEGVKFADKLGLKRVVLARETNIDMIKQIKKETNIELEVFIHGSLCVSYSGQCLMSSLIGNRSGNRGSCAGPCRQKYSINGKEEYLLSTKDLAIFENIKDLIDLGIESLKIEGRMKSPSYVYTVTKLYREAIDSYLSTGKVLINETELNNLKLIFNRQFTKGYLFGESNIVNTFRPNHLGVSIGKVVSFDKGLMQVKLSNELNVQDGIRVLSNEDAGEWVTIMYKDNLKIKTGKKGDVVSIPFKVKVVPGSEVVKTTDALLLKSIDNLISSKKRKVKVTGILKTMVDKPIELILTDSFNEVSLCASITQIAINSPTSRERITEQLSKLGNTIYELDDLKIIGDENVFIPIKELNDLRNKTIEKLNSLRLYEYEYMKEEYKNNNSLKNYPQYKNYNALIEPIYYEKLKHLKFTNIYSVENLNDERFILKLNRVINNYPQYKQKLLVGELGSINYYKEVETDFSLNIVNSYAIALLHEIGVEKITLSLELEFDQIKDIIKQYKNRYNKNPNVEVIVFGKEEVMISKHKISNMVENFGLKDRLGNLYTVKNEEYMTLYNYKTRDIKNYKDLFEIGVNNVRYNILNDTDLALFLNKNVL